MKNSTKFILIVLAVIAVLFAVMTVIARNIVNDHLVIMKDQGKFEVSISGSDEGEHVEKEYNFSNFDEIRIRGGWDILILEDDEFRVTVDFYKTNESDYSVTEDGGVLNLSMDNMKVSKRYHGASATIYMPALSAVDVDGAVNMNIEGFTQETFELELSGAGSITGEACDFENFNLSSNGAINVDFDESDIFNADVYLGGAGNVQLHMTGGVLSGNMEGFGNLEYSGDVSKLDVEKDGIGSVSKID